MNKDRIKGRVKNVKGRLRLDPVALVPWRLVA